MCKEYLSWILNAVPDFTIVKIDWQGVSFLAVKRKHTEESHSFSTVQQLIVHERDDHDGSDHNLAIDNDRSVLDGVHAWIGVMC